MFLLKKLVVPLDLPDLVAYAFSLLLYILRLLVIHRLMLFLLVPVRILVFEEVLDLPELGAVNDALLNFSLLLLDFEFFKEK